MEIIYHNLGASWGIRNMYIRSTDIEQMNWDALLSSFPDEALYFMSVGYKIVILDACNKPRGKVERIFAPAFIDFLRHLKGLDPINNKVIAHTTAAINAFKSNKNISKKYRHFNKYILNYKIEAHTVHHKKEPSIWKHLK